MGGVYFCTPCPTTLCDMPYWFWMGGEFAANLVYERNVSYVDWVSHREQFVSSVLKKPFPQIISHVWCLSCFLNQKREEIEWGTILQGSCSYIWEVKHITVLSYTGLHSSYITLSLLALFKLNERFNLVVTTEADTYHNTKGGWVGG